MVRVSLASLAFLVLLAGPALADNKCVQPYAPDVPNGGTATKDQMLTAHDEVTAFIKASDNYQECVLLDVKMQRDRNSATRSPSTNPLPMRRRCASTGTSAKRNAWARNIMRRSRPTLRRIRAGHN